MKVFVSHSHKDKEALHKLRKRMWGYGIDLFLAHEDINPGENDLERIKQEVSRCDVFLIIGNKYSKQSEYCNQEIGMAIAHKKAIISTVHVSLSPWGFTQRQQAIRYGDILTDLPCELKKQIKKLPEYKEYWKPQLKSLEELGIKGFSVDKWETHYIHLKSDKFNDYGYCTTFHIHEDSRIGSVKIGYKDQTPEKRDTKDKLPQYFPFLRDKFFSYIKLEGETLSESKKQALYYLLNDVRYNKKIAKKYINEGVLINSLFRDERKELKELKKELED